MIFVYQDIPCKQIIKWVMTASELGNDIQDLASAWIIRVYPPMPIQSTIFNVQIYKYNLLSYHFLVNCTLQTVQRDLMSLKVDNGMNNSLGLLELMLLYSRLSIPPFPYKELLDYLP